MNTYILHSQNLILAEKLTNELQGELEERKSHFRIHTNLSVDLKKFRDLYGVDINILSKTFDYSRVALLLSDMDSTLITNETINDIASPDIADKVSSITEQAMHGSLDFTSSFKSKISLLKGTKSETLEKVYNEQLNLSKGAQEFINFFKLIDVKIAVISGGLSYFAERLKNQLGFDNYRASEIEIKENCLTGNVIGKVIDADAKAQYVQELCVQYGLEKNQVVAIGDGANDLEMMKIVGLSIAYHAKPLLQNNCDVVINYGGLDTVIDFFELM